MVVARWHKRPKQSFQMRQVDHDVHMIKLSKKWRKRYKCNVYELNAVSLLSNCRPRSKSSTGFSQDSRAEKTFLKKKSLHLL